MPEPESQTTTKPARDPQALSSEYHKARKQLMLWAGILFIWELVGIDLEKAKEAGGNAGAIITSIRSPQAVPWVLLVLVAYFLFKTTIEWHQCSGTRRALRVSKVDFGSAWIVTVLAYGLYVYQAISRIQFADVLQSSSRGQSLMMAFGVSFVSVALIKVLNKELSRKERKMPDEQKLGVGSYLGLLLLMILMLVGGVFLNVFNWRYTIVGVVLGALVGLTTYLLDRVLGFPNPHNHPVVKDQSIASPEDFSTTENPTI